MYSDNKEINKIQHACIEVLYEIDRICNENHIPYNVCGGTLIGAIREKGFIPWDDDIDIMMPREGYDKFITIAPKLLKNEFSLSYYKFDDGDKVFRMAARVLDLRTGVIQEWSKNKQKTYAGVDILPIDGMPSSLLRQNLRYYHYIILRFLIKASNFDDVVNLYRSGRPFYEELLIRTLKHIKLSKIIDSKKLMDKTEKLLRKYPLEYSNMVASMHGSYRKKEIIPRAWVEKVYRGQFENITVNIPFYYDDMLRHYYGDYMTPPESTQEKEGHHRVKSE